MIDLEAHYPVTERAQLLSAQRVDPPPAERVHLHEPGPLERLQMLGDLRPGGQLVHTMTATAPEQIEFMNNAGMPLSTESRKTFTEVSPPTRLTYLSVIDFVPDQEPYEHLTAVEITPSGERTEVVMTVNPMHDETWTQRILAGRNNELDNLQAATARRA